MKEKFFHRFENIASVRRTRLTCEPFMMTLLQCQLAIIKDLLEDVLSIRPQTSDGLPLGALF